MAGLEAVQLLEADLVDDRKLVLQMPLSCEPRRWRRARLFFDMQEVKEPEETDREPALHGPHAEHGRAGVERGRSKDEVRAPGTELQKLDGLSFRRRCRAEFTVS
ncbi:MAG: hypothetical protein CSA62_12685 [Planctomycetota bacterium]|nr:MAG: hypothetical protein CSA62_12685 [Planctomycetota bacterium]